MGEKLELSTPISMKKIVGLMLVKSDSKRLLGKNTLDFHGEPMFLVNLKKCLKIFDEVYVSTDSLTIGLQSEKAGARVIYRESKLCGDTPNIPVYQFSLRNIDCDAFVAVQANSPTLDKGLIYATKKLLEKRWEEVMTCHPDFTIYGSIWAMTRKRLSGYGNPYKPTPEILIVDESIDIHTKEDYDRCIHSN